MGDPMDKQCAACGKMFLRRSQIIKQRYCSKSECQRERRRLWQRDTRRKDPTYRQNQAEAKEAWSQRNPDYWREYRRTHPKYKERNRVQQRIRNSKRKAGAIAKMDVSMPDSPVPSGTYQLIPLTLTGIAKMDVWTVEIRFLSSNCSFQEEHRRDCKRGRNGLGDA